MPNELKPQIQQVIADIFGLAPESVDANTSPETVDDWDSISHLNLVLSLEDAFQVTFSPDEIAKLVSVGAILEQIAQKRSE
jgi:acyl carrier protein